jgi:hypothetical protein
MKPRTVALSFLGPALVACSEGGLPSASQTDDIEQAPSEDASSGTSSGRGLSRDSGSRIDALAEDSSSPLKQADSAIDASGDAGGPGTDSASSPDAGLSHEAGSASDAGGVPPWSGFYKVTDLTTTTTTPVADLLCNRDASYINAQLGSIVYIGAYPQDVEMWVYVAQANEFESANTWQILDLSDLGSQSNQEIDPDYLLTFDGEYGGGAFDYFITAVPDIGRQDLTVTYTPTSTGLVVKYVYEVIGETSCVLTRASNPSDSGPPPQAYGHTT